MIANAAIARELRLVLVPGRAGPAERIGTYLSAVAAELCPASTRFRADLYTYRGRGVYEINNRIAGRVVRGRIEDGAPGPCAGQIAGPACLRG